MCLYIIDKSYIVNKVVIIIMAWLCREMSDYMRLL